MHMVYKKDGISLLPIPSHKPHDGRRLLSLYRNQILTFMLWSVKMYDQPYTQETRGEKYVKT